MKLPRPLLGRRLPAALCLVLAGCASMSPSGPAHEVLGSGEPTVVLASGYGMPRDTWRLVADELSRDFAVFTFDRPGYGSQPDTERPRDPCTIATETRDSLRAAGRQPPYLLVGHSLGGLYQYAFARMYPQEVSGFVLLDPTHPRHLEMLKNEQPLTARALEGMIALSASRSRRNEFYQQTDCLRDLDMLRAPTQPARILVSRRYRQPEKDLAPALQALQEDWRILTGVRDTDKLWDSGHHIQTERPDAVARAVRAVAGRADTANGVKHRPSQITVGARGDKAVTLGISTEPAVRSQLGRPDEVHHDGGRTIWVYRAPGVSVPTAVGLIPILGDLAELVSLAQKAADRYETIIEFDTRGVVQHARRRMVED